jgi:formylglycine-generating enzyme required for sulfatase activity
MKTIRLLPQLFILLIPVFLTSQTRGFKEKKIIINDERGIPQEIKLYDSLYAVIVGIDRYQNLETNQYLQNAVGDAKGIESVLREQYPFGKIITLYNDNATRDNIFKTLGALKSQTSKSDGLFIFFAGHGNTVKRVDGSETGYLLPYDGSFKPGDDYKNLSMSQLRDQMQEIPAKHLLFVADACFSGTLLTRGNEASREQNYAYYKQAANEIVRQVLTAGLSTETVLDGGLEGHSVFTGRLIEALKKNGSFVSANELGVMMQRVVSSDANVRNHKQTPQFGRLYGEGDFVFVCNAALGIDSETKLKEELARLQKERLALESKKQQAAAETKKKQEQEVKDKLAVIERNRQLEADEKAKREADERERAAEEKRKLELKAKIDAEKSRLSESDLAGMSLEEAEATIEDLTKKIDTSNVEVDRQMQRQILLEVKDGPRDEFESTAEYRQRLDKAKETRERIQREYGELKVQNTGRIGADILAIKSKTYPFRRKTNVKLEKYDADRQQYTLQIIDSKSKELVKGGFITISRDEARTLSQNKELLRAEVSGKAHGEMVAVIVEPEGGKKYDLVDLSSLSKSFTNSIGMELVLVPSGTFQMGSNVDATNEKPVHEVTISKFFHIGRCEVTQSQWRAIMGNNPSKFVGDDRPVESISWNDVQNFIHKLNEKEGANKYRLPTEAEWEFAAGGGAQNWRLKFSGSDNVQDVAVFIGNSGSETHPVGSKRPNELGIFDMSGNVW